MWLLVDLEMKSGERFGLIFSMKNKPRSSAARVEERGSQGFQDSEIVHSLRRKKLSSTGLRAPLRLVNSYLSYYSVEIVSIH